MISVSHLGAEPSLAEVLDELRALRAVTAPAYRELLERRIAELEALVARPDPRTRPR